MDIGIFVPHYTADRMKNILKEYPHIKFHFFIYDELSEINEAFEKNIHFLDGVLFSGLLAYMLVEKTFGLFSKPVTYLKLSEADFYKKMFQISLKHPGIDFSKVFLDFHVETEEVQRFIEQFPEHKRPKVPKKEDIYVSNDVYERLKQLHKEMHESKEVKWSFTRFVNITRFLEKEGFRHVYFEISDRTVHEALFNLMNEINLHYLKDNQIVCGELQLSQLPEYLKEIRLLNTHSLLLDFNKQINHQLQIRENNDKFTIITTYASLEMLTDHFSACLLLDFLGKYIKEQIHIGWGTGKSFVQAQANAKRACDYSIHN